MISIHPFQPSAALRVTGEDALEFLQGQFTHELRAPVGSATYGLWLNQKGKVLADSEILRIAEREFLVTSPASLASTLIERLEQYIIADDVILDDQTAATKALSIWGEGAAELIQKVVGQTPARGSFVNAPGVLVFNARNGESGHFVLLGWGEALQELRTAVLALGCTEASDNEAEFARIEAGVPSIPQDIGPTDLPQEAGLDETAVSFTKGCYLGQEVMARLKSMGKVRRRLRKIRGTGSAPVHGATLFQAGRKVGEVRSSVATSTGFVALAMLTQMGLDENAGLSLDSAGENKSPATIWMN